MTVIKAGLFQTHWRGSKAAQLDAHEQIAHDAAKQGNQVLCFQELFMGPFFAQVQDSEWYDWAEAVPDGPIVQRFSSIAKETGQVLVLPVYEEVQPGVMFNTAAVIDADGTYLGKYRKTHIPQVKGFWEKFYFRPGVNDGWPVFETAVGKVGVYICYDRHFPEGWRGLGLAGAELVFNPSATSRGLSKYIWEVEQVAASVANMYYVGALNRVGVEADLGDNDFYGTSYFVDPRGKYVGDVASDTQEELVLRDLDLDVIREVRAQWAFYRDRRPDTYTILTDK
ncbi:nitrilase-related carbon-nitrogen hydrolase [Rudaeicoccus suwonensis]|uniref:N-carbamoylputrescine amidase n=1 Tax=Rudaeicoccus suwonensis TaxID=657409 RepID=A0A561ECS8_9MICO|nr:nitrilase-related carbon-nitrogen hydrolase [Rudaeicoccus suwonensis]TWE13414.1 N-carbamoylputrescine amidase [Rudaeicoccus suwonensis]